MASSPSSTVAIPSLYRLVFLYVEPVSTFAGAVYAHLLQHSYLTLTHAPSAPAAPAHIPLSTSIVLTQLANLYLLLCLNEALVLRATHDVHVWRVFLFGLLVADIGHLGSVAGVGTWVYWDVRRWNAIDWGNVPFVYFLAMTRVCFLLRVGFGRTSDVRRKKGL